MSRSLVRSSALLSISAIAASAAKADIFYSGPVNLSTTGVTTSGIPFDLNGDSINDFSFKFKDSTTKPTVSNVTDNNRSNLVFSVPTGVNGGAENGLPATSAGTTVDSSFLGGPQDWEGWFYQDFDNNVAGAWYNDGAGATGYVGLAMVNGTDMNYGWAQFTYTPSTTTLTLLDFAYETTPNTAIVTAAVPEPSSACLLAAGALGLAALRKRRQQS